MLGREGEVEAIRQRWRGTRASPSICAPRVVEDDANDGGLRVVPIDELQELDELAASVAVHREAVDLARKEDDSCHEADGASAHVFVVARDRGPPGVGGRPGEVVLIAWMP